MSLNEIQQISQLLQDKKNILITFRKDSKEDSVASAIALLLFLKKIGKQADVICDGWKMPASLKFLKKAEFIKPSFGHLQKFVVNIDVAETGVQELSYDLKDKKLRIFITPKQGFLSKENVRTAQSDFKYDIIFVLDTPDLESLGALYDNNTELFYNQPIINIDYHSSNEHFGQINIIEPTATSTGEVLFNVLKKTKQEYIDEEVATAILTAIVANTNSFKTANIKPQTLATASELIHLGANRDYIIQNLYRTRTLATLKLWGRALANLQHDNSIGIVWTTLTRDDFIRSGAKEEDLKDIVAELISNSPEAKLILLLHEQIINNQQKIHGLLTTDKAYDALELVKPFNPRGDKSEATFIILNKTLKQAENEVIESIKSTISNQ